MQEKRHCCCCVPLPDGVMLVGVYGTAFHTGLLIIQIAHGATLAPDPEILEPPIAVEIIRPLLLISHFLGILVNCLLLLGMYWGKRRLMLPWLAIQGLLAAILALLASYYIALFPVKSSCSPSSTSLSASSRRGDASYLFNQRPVIISSSSRRQSTSEENLNLEGGGSPYFNTYCTQLLWYGAVMIFSLIILLYYFYIVQDFLDQLKIEKRKEQARWKIEVAPREDSLDGNLHDLGEAAAPEAVIDLEHDENEIVVVPDEAGRSHAQLRQDLQRQQRVMQEQQEVPPKIPSRVAWNNDVTVLE